MASGSGRDASIRGQITRRQAVERNLTPEQLAERYPGITPNTLKFWRHKGTGPRWFRAGKYVFYRESDIAAWEAEQVRQAAARRAPLSLPG